MVLSTLLVICQALSPFYLGWPFKKVWPVGHPWRCIYTYHMRSNMTLLQQSMDCKNAIYSRILIAPYICVCLPINKDAV